MSRTSSIARLVVIASSLFAGNTRAEVSRCSSADLDLAQTDELFHELDADTGWFPSGSPAQLRLTGRIAGQTTVALGLRPTACWDGLSLEGSMVMSAPGRAGGGVLDFAYGAELHLFAQIHTSVLGVAIDWEGEIPLGTDFLLGATTMFDPVPGGPTSSANDTTSPLHLLSTDPIGTYIGITGISGGLYLDAVGALTTGFDSTKIAIDGQEVITSNATVLVQQPPEGYGDSIERPIAASGALHYHPALIFNVGADIKILGIRVASWELFSMTLPLPSLDRAVGFPEQAAHVPLPNTRSLANARIDLADQASQSLAIENTGEAPLELEPSSLPPGVTVDRVVIAPGQVGALVVMAGPDALATADSLVLATNDPDQPSVTIAVGRDIGGTSLDGGDAAGGCNAGGGAGLLLGLAAVTALHRRRRAPTSDTVADPPTATTIAAHECANGDANHRRVFPPTDDPTEDLPAGEDRTLVLEAPQERFELGPVLGAGGMGEVRLARDHRVGREVAIKALHRRHPTPQQIARFLREARIQALLDHPAIVPVYDLGVDHTGAPYFAMKRLTGVGLDAVLEARRAGVVTETSNERALLGRLVDVCLAIEFAHQRGIVHRDLKPGNIMFGDYGEVYVLDWGIARILDSAPGGLGPGSDTRRELGDATDRRASQLTEAGAVFGTLGYMAPEQRRGEPTTTRADVYALGCVLFEVLTLHPALSRNAGAELPTVSLSPRSLLPTLDVPPELDELCVRATAPRAEDRNLTARELAAGIQRYLDGARDVERRRDLATELALAARAKLVGCDDDTRKQAMREAGRALALAPEDDVVRKLVDDVFAPAAAVPAEVEHELERAGTQASTAQIRIGAAVYASYVAVLSALWLSAGHSPWIAALTAAVGFNMLAFLFAAKRDRPLGPLLLPGLAVHCGTIMFAGIVLSPVLVVPALAVGAIAGFLTQPSSFRPVPVIIAHLICVAAPIALEVAGILPSSFTLAADGLHVHPWAVELSAGSCVAVLAVVAVGQLLGTAALVIQLRRAKAEAERALHVQLWQLRQLVPPTA